MSTVSAGHFFLITFAFQIIISSSCCCCAFQQLMLQTPTFPSFRRLSPRQEQISSVEEREKIWLELVNAVDLRPLLQAISKYCVTSRGRNALLSLIGDDNSNRNMKGTGRRTKSGIRFSGKRFASTGGANLEQPFTIIKVAQSANEARQEYNLVQEALELLRNSKKYMQSHSKNYRNGKEEAILPFDDDTLPPIYNTNTLPLQVSDYSDDEDEDYEWLKEKDDLELVDILYAEQSIMKIVSLQKWSQQPQSSIIRRLAPGILSALSELLMEEEFSSCLQTVWETIANSVEIVRRQQHNTSGGIGQQHYLKLNSSKFPVLASFENIESSILADIEIEKQKRKGDGKMDGKFLMKNVRADIASIVGGIIKRYIDHDKYVDLLIPMSMLDLVNKLIQVQDQKSHVEREIMRNFHFTISQNKLQLQRGLDIVGLIDTILARASFGYNYNGIFPRHIYQGSCISIMNFMHPVLLVLGERPVVPIDLDLTGDKKAILISGPNGGGKSLGLTSLVLLHARLYKAFTVAFSFSASRTALSSAIFSSSDYFLCLKH